MACRPENSGFQGPWTNDEDELDHAFFQEMVAPPWNVLELDNGLSQWCALSTALSPLPSDHGPLLNTSATLLNTAA